MQLDFLPLAFLIIAFKYRRMHPYLILWCCLLGCQGPFLRNWPTDQSWIALIQRGNCTFNTKIANALGLKASGVIIYDYEKGGQVLQSMKVEPFSIPSVFTYHWKGMLFRFKVPKIVPLRGLISFSHLRV